MEASAQETDNGIPASTALVPSNRRVFALAWDPRVPSSACVHALMGRMRVFLMGCAAPRPQERQPSPPSSCSSQSLHRGGASRADRAVPGKVFLAAGLDLTEGCASSISRAWEEATGQGTVPAALKESGRTNTFSRSRTHDPATASNCSCVSFTSPASGEHHPPWSPCQCWRASRRRTP